MQFAFDPEEPKSPYKLARHEENDVVYTGTHDHDTARGWYEDLEPESREEFDREVAAAGVEEPESWWSLVRLTMSSRCQICMLQLQDVLGLGSDARMNFPGTVGPQNWSWRMEEGVLTPALAKRLREATGSAGRLP